MPVFDVIVVRIATKEVKEEIVVPVQQVVAPSAEYARLKVVAKEAATLKDKLDEVSVIVRPFA